MSGPPVSVVIPVFDAERYLAEAIESVLGQTRPPREVIVVDDGSTDASLAVARRFEPAVRCLAQEHRGIGAARNAGLSAATGALLAFQDADDVWRPDKLARQVDALLAEPEADLAWGLVEEFVSPELPEDVQQGLRCRPGPLAAQIPGALLVRRSAFDRVGPFDPAWRVGEFLDWYARALDLGLREVVVRHLVLRRRIHGANHGIRARQDLSDYARILKGSLDRRRARAAAEGRPGPGGP